MNALPDVSRERVLAIDYGERRIGLALAEPGQALVRGLPTIDRGKRRDDPLLGIERIVHQDGVQRIVLGIPYTMSGDEGPQAVEVRAFQSRLAAAVEVPIEEWDERLTTEAARRRLRELGYDEKETRARVDQLSAVLMLESWLQRRAVDAVAEAPAATDPEPRRRGPRAILLLVALLALAAIGGLWWATGSPARGPESVRVTVQPGTPVRSLSHRLESQGVVRSALLLETWLRLRGEAGRIQAGTYDLPRDENLFSIAGRLVRGETVLAAVTVPEGLRLEEIAGLAYRVLEIDSAAFAVAASDPALADSLLAPIAGKVPATLEGYLFPETYRVDPAIGARPLARVMVAQFQRVFGPAWRARAESLGFSVHEIVTLASIVEEEAKVPEERTTIAGVFWNRLKRGMPLEADPTVQYALGGHKARVLYRDLEVDSPYNTYRNVGLPPGPIASPGRAALEATLYPDSVPYFYFFATGEDGGHTFSETYEEHLRKRRELGR